MGALRVRGPGLDAATAVAAAGVGAATIVLGPRSDRPAAEWVLVEAAALALVLLRHTPLATLAAEVVLIVVIDVVLPATSHVAPLAAGLALGAVAYRHGTVITAASWAATFAAVLISVGRDGGGLLTGADGVVRVLSMASAVAAPVAFGRYLAALRQAAAVAQERARDAEARRLVETRAARLAERARIAGDLHDLVAHHVSAIALRAGSGRYAATHATDPGRRLDEAVSALESVHTSAHQALLDLRGLLRLLREPAEPTDPTDPHGPRDPRDAREPEPVVDPERMITDSVARSRAAGLRVTLARDERATAVPPALRLATARVLQEALTNALKHAGPGSDVAATVAVRDDQLHIDIANSAPPRQSIVDSLPLPGSGHGLTAMRERVEFLGGTLAAGPAPGGWRLRVALPLATPS